MENTTSVLQTSPEIDKLTEALAQAQGELEAAARDSENPYFSSSYSSLAALKAVARPHLAKNGLAVFQASASELLEASGKVFVTTRLAHSSGQWAESTLTLPVLPMGKKKKEGDSDADRAPGKITAQAVGSAITYGMRYGYSAMVGVVPEADDDDGNAASSGAEANILPIPANGLIEDVVVTVSCAEKPKRDGGTFVVCTVETGKHGSFECWENIGSLAELYAGKDTVCQMRAEKTKFGPKLLSIQARPELPGAKELAEVKEAVAKVDILDDLGVLKGKLKDKGGAYWTGDIYEIFRKRGIELGAPEISTKPAPEASNREPVHVEAWRRELSTCPDAATFEELEASWKDSAEIKSAEGTLDALKKKGKELKVAGYV